jgi:type IV secretion system protein VirD4
MKLLDAVWDVVKLVILFVALMLIGIPAMLYWYGGAWLAAAWYAFLALVWLLHWAFWPHRKVPGNRARYTRLRLHMRLHPGRGFATVFELWLRWGRLASYRESKRTRPKLSRKQRFCRAAAHSVYFGRAHYRHGVRASIQEHVLIMAPPRAFKTAWLGDVILHHPGAAVITSVKEDIFRLTSGVRATGGPVLAFSPEGLGGVFSSFAWNPVPGCEDPAVADRRAQALVHAVSVDATEDSTFWRDKACQLLAALFRAAAIKNGDLFTVAGWVFVNADNALKYLNEFADNAATRAEKAGALTAKNALRELHRSPTEKTAATIRMVLSKALDFLSDPSLATCVLPGRGTGFDIPSFLHSRGTLYMLASADRETSRLAPLFAALIGEIRHMAAQIAQSSPGGRLDPPLGLFLDECTQIAPCPVDKWLAASGGLGIQIFTVVHGQGQLAERWGESGRQVIMDTSSVKVYLPGITDTGMLEVASKMCGQVSLRLKRQEHYTLQDIIDTATIRTLPRRYALIVRGGLSPVIAKLPVVWKDKLYKHAKRHGLDIAQIVPASAEVSTQPVIAEMEREWPGSDAA